MSIPVQEIRMYIANKNPSFYGFSDVTDMIEHDLIKMSELSEFVSFVEWVANVKIDPGSVDIENFRTLKHIESYIAGLHENI